MLGGIPMSKDTIKALIDQYLELEQSEKNQRRKAKWKYNAPIGRDQIRLTPKTDGSWRTEGAPFAADMQNQYWIQILGFDLIRYYKDPEYWLEYYLKMKMKHFEMFDEEGRFNTEDFDYKVKKLTRNQEHLVIILNTPANNPTGYALTMDDWYAVKKTLDEVPLEKKIALVLDVAYIDFAGEPEEVRRFFGVVDNLRSNILPIIAYSASKTFTLYGGRCAAMICFAHSPEVAEEFEKVNSYSSRATWSNPPRAPQEVIERIYAD